MSNEVLIDGDLVAFRAASATERAMDFGSEDPRDPEMWVTWANPEDIRRAVDSMLCDISREAAKAMKWRKWEDVIFLTDNSIPNWRYKVLPTYKHNRKEMRQPTGLYWARKYIMDEYNTCMTPGLEADDLLGMNATEFSDGTTIIASADKDLRSIPGNLYDFLKKKHHVITEEMADKFHIYQTIAGDAVDGYSGVPGLGKTYAETFIESPYKLVKTEKVLSRGPRKGETVIEWVKTEDYESIWECVVSLYEKAGLNEEYALEQARVARILRHGEYDWNTKEVKLWEPK